MSRIGLCALAAVVVAGCGSSGGLGGSKPTGIASIAAQCFQYGGPAESGAPCRSPDGEWKVIYGWHPRGLFFRRGAGVEVEKYSSHDACCDMVTWVKPHTLLFVDDYRLLRLDPATGRSRQIAAFSDFVASPNERWLAGWADPGPHDASTVYVESPDGRTCLVVPHTTHESDTAAGFTPDSENAIVARSPFSPNNGTTGASQLVQYPISALPAC